MNTTPFEPLQEARTRKDYAGVFADLLLFLIKTGPSAEPADFKTDLTREQMEHARALATIVDSKAAGTSNASFDTAIHQLAWSVFTAVVPSTVKDEFKSPVHQFLIGCCIDREGSFKSAALVTPVIARLLYIMRLTYFQQCSRKSQGSGKDLLQ